MSKLIKIDKSSIKDDLVAILNNYSSKILTHNELQNFKDRKEHINNYLNLLNIFEQSSDSNEESFMSSLSSFIDASFSIKEDELSEILVIYFLNIVPTIADFFNSQKLKDKKRHIKKVKKMFIENTRRVIVSYEDELVKVLKKI